MQLASYDICREKEKWLQIIRIFFPGKGKATGSFNTAKGRERERLKEREREREGFESVCVKGQGREK